MASRIAGITIEIGGDTTKLSNALSGVNKSISQTQSALKDVNNLLKLNPGNVELLTQKHKGLKTEIEETKNKLKSLKEASEQAAKTKDNYDAWKAKYDPLQEEIKQTTDKLTKLKDASAKAEKDLADGKISSGKYDALQKEVKETEDKLKDLRAESKAVTDEFGHPIAPEQYDALQREIIETKQNLSELKKEYHDFGSVAKQELELVGSKMEAAGEKVKNVSSKIGDIGGKLTAKVTTPILGLGTATATMAVGFEDAMAKVSTIADTTEVPLDTLREQILELSDQTGISASEIADNVYNAISAGQKTGDAVNFVSNATQLAKAGFTDSASSLDILTTTLNAYGMEASEVTRVSDVLIQTQNLGKTTVGELAAAMGKVIPTAKANGVSLENLASMYAVMTANGVATAETTTYLNSMLNELGKQGTTAADAFATGTEHIKEGGLTMQEAMESGWELTDVLSILDEQAAASGTSIQNMFSSAEAGKAANILWDQGKKLNTVVEQMGDAAGSTQTAFDKLNTTSFNAKKALNELKNVGIDLGTQLLEMLEPAIKMVGDAVSSLKDWWSGLNDTQKESIIKIAGVVAAVGPVVSILGKVGSGIGNVISVGGKLIGALGNLTSPVGLVVTAIGGLVAAGVALYNNWDEIKAWASEKWNAIKETVSGAAEKIKTGLSNAWENVKTAASTAWDNVKTTISTAWDNIKNSVSTAAENVKSKLSTAWENVKSKTSSAWDNVKSRISSAWENIKSNNSSASSLVTSALSSAWETVKSKTSSAWDNVKSRISSAWDNIKSNNSSASSIVTSTISKAWETVKSKTSSAWDNVKSKVSSAWENIKSKASSSAENVKSKVSSAWENIKSKTSSTWENAKSTVAKAISSIVSDHDKLNDAKSIVSNIFGNIKSTISSKMEDAKNGVANAIEKIKSFFHFEWSLPKIKLPHFSIAGKFSLNPPQIPKFSVEWYKKAMNDAAILTSPTIFGAGKNGLLGGGEAGREVVSGESHLIGLINDSVDAALGARLDNILALMAQYLPEAAKTKVAVLTDSVDRALAANTTRRTRGW